MFCCPYFRSWAFPNRCQWTPQLVPAVEAAMKDIHIEGISDTALKYVLPPFWRALDNCFRFFLACTLTPHFLTHSLSITQFQLQGFQHPLPWLPNRWRRCRSQTPFSYCSCPHGLPWSMQGQLELLVQGTSISIYFPFLPLIDHADFCRSGPTSPRVLGPFPSPSATLTLLRAWPSVSTLAALASFPVVLLSPLVAWTSLSLVASLLHSWMFSGVLFLRLSRISWTKLSRPSWTISSTTSWTPYSPS